jgi:nitric oxide reductase subunit B
MSIGKLKWAAIVSFIVSMVLLVGGGMVAREDLPPYPERVEGPEGDLLFGRSDIMAGQGVYQRYGLMDHGSVWGHGAQRGMEFSATTLHLMGRAVRSRVAQTEYNTAYEDLTGIQRDIVDLKTRRELKANRYKAEQDTLALSAVQEEALEEVSRFWDKTFGEGHLRYGFLPNTVRSPEDRRQIARFFFWTAWVASAKRPGTDHSYTNNWPADRKAGNVPTEGTYIWTLGGILSLFIVLGIFIFFVHHYGLWYGRAKGVPLADKLVDMPLTPSQFKAAKYFLVVVLLFLLQTNFGGLLAHYTVHPASFWFPLVANIIPYSWAKTWHLQLAIFWIATTWVGSAIYLAPIIGGVEPRRQGTLVQVLFIAILVVAGGSLLGEIAGIKGLLGDWWFWLGHQGWEFLELGRFWQLALFVGLIAWLVIVYRAVVNHIQLKHRDEYTSLILFYLFSAIMVVAFFGFNIGLLLMTVGTLFPVGILQTWTSYKEGLWAARDASFFEGSFVHFLGSIRVIPDLVIILVGVVPLTYFLIRTYPHLKAAGIKEGESVWDRLGVEL